MAISLYPAGLPTPQSSTVTPAERRALSDANRPREARALERDRREFERITWPPMLPAKTQQLLNWWRTDLIYGGAWFSAVWPLPRGQVQAVRKLREQPRWQFVPGGLWRLSALCEVRGAGVLPDMDGGGGGDGATVTPMLVDTFTADDATDPTTRDLDSHSINGVAIAGFARWREYTPYVVGEIQSNQLTGGVVAEIPADRQLNLHLIDDPDAYINHQMPLTWLLLMDGVTIGSGGRTARDEDCYCILNLVSDDGDATISVYKKYLVADTLTVDASSIAGADFISASYDLAGFGPHKVGLYVNSSGANLIVNGTVLESSTGGAGSFSTIAEIFLGMTSNAAPDTPTMLERFALLGNLTLQDAIGLASTPAILDTFTAANGTNPTSRDMDVHPSITGLSRWRDDGFETPGAIQSNRLSPVGTNPYRCLLFAYGDASEIFVSAFPYFVMMSANNGDAADESETVRFLVSSDSLTGAEVILANGFLIAAVDSETNSWAPDPAPIGTGTNKVGIYVTSTGASLIANGTVVASSGAIGFGTVVPINFARCEMTGTLGAGPFLNEGIDSAGVYRGITIDQALELTAP